MRLINDFFDAHSPSNRLEGPKQAVVLIHGLGLNSALWETLTPYLYDKYYIITYDLPGHGVEHVHPLPFTWSDICDQFIAFLDKNRLDTVHLIGHGLGANLAVKAALRVPLRIQSLSLLSLPGFIPSEYLKQGIEDRIKLMLSNDRASFITHILPSLTLQYESDEISSRISQAYQSVHTGNYLKLLQLFRENDTIADLKSLSTPTILLVGEQDPVYTPVLSAISASYIPQGRFQVIPGAANLIFMDQPKWTAYWVCKHIDTSSSIAIDTENAMPDTTISLHKVIQSGQHLLQNRQELDIQFLHSFRICVNGVELPTGWNKRFAKQLLLYLLLFPNATRQQMYDDLWPNYELKKAQNYLRVCLSHLKSLLEQHSEGSEFLRIDREHITLQGNIRCDLLDLIHNLKEAMNEQNEEVKAARILQIWENLPRHLLSGYVDDWILGTRDKIEWQLTVLAHWLKKKGNLSDMAVNFNYIAIRNFLHEEE
ncbi:alpha/beta fold hydrolase [Paenibacillus sp. LjRoot153]|uniref:alpha/beta fold hydrolase n=1 Tax=Paenibacillus sp. LjRoot153 TaxID=3342270 RepID=UPI003ECDE46B